MAIEAVPVILSPRGVKSITLTAVFWTLAGLCVVLRLFTNRKFRGRISVSDWLIVGAFFAFTGHAILTIIQCLLGGLGFHSTDVSPMYLLNSYKLGMGEQITFAVCLGLTKCSICILLMAIFPLPRLRLAATTISILCVLWSIATILVAFLICRPLLFGPPAAAVSNTCANPNPAWISMGSIDVFFDALIMCLPMPYLAKLKLGWLEKAAVWSFFIIGLLTITIGIIRTVTVHEASWQDPLYDAYWVITWTMLEPAVAVIVACLMTLRPLCQSLGLRLGWTNDYYDTHAYQRNHSRPSQDVGDRTATNSGYGAFNFGFDQPPSTMWSDDDGTTVGRGTPAQHLERCRTDSLTWKNRSYGINDERRGTDDSNDTVTFAHGATPTLGPNE